MNFEDKLIQSLQEKRKEINPPDELKHKVVSQMEKAEYRKSKITKQVVASCIAVFLLLPTSVFAYQAYLADELYGSFDNLKKHFVSATFESYMLLNGKLLQAKGELGAQEYNQFKEQLQVITSFKMEYGDHYGNIDYTELEEGKRLEIKEALMTVQPFFDKLNGHESSQVVLSAEEYDAYIEALMTYESILVQSGINPSNLFEIEDINSEQVGTFLDARNLIEDVDKKVQLHNMSPNFSS
ncbi:DUF3600 domain-containing protein [Bacillus alkalicellulosilyticus]|uniref:DUF3600 domain-containing protein n=1 Tax=Alkalihalobacterium alkalicellulosilyticum TaxID=1912214 RepID=UPI000998B946|nr:DUF3600 domain-containing protein [Bacillus alkalicellulosilyticus]